MVLESVSDQLRQFRELNGQMMLLVFNAAVGGFSYGYALTAMAVAVLQAKRLNRGTSDQCPGLTDHALSIVEQEMLTSFLLLGAFIGSCFAGYLNCPLGRRKTTLFASFILGVGALLMAFVETVPSMLVARLVTGLGVGISSHTVPLYVSECAPTHFRGAFCGINAIMIPGGQVAAAIFGCVLFWTETPNGWRWMLGAALVPSVLMFVGFFLQPESPRWLLSKGREEEAREAFAILRCYDENAKEVLALIRGSTGISETARLEAENKEFLDMAQAIKTQQPCQGNAYDIYWKDPAIRRALALGCFLMFMNQCVGLNLILLYGPSVLEAATGHAYAAQQGTCFTRDSKLNVTFNILFPLLQMIGVLCSWFFVESVGRRPLILTSTAFVAIFLAATGAAFSATVVSMPTVMICLTLYLVAFGIGLAPVPWAVNAEIYPLHVRAQCLSMALAAKWFWGFVTSQTYLSLSHVLSTSATEPRGHPNGIFWLHSLIAMAALPLLWRYMVETKGVALEQTRELFMDKTGEASSK